MLALRFKDDDVLEVGIDEAGRGCFWGPLMAGACAWPPRSAWTAEHESVALEIRDSKKLSPKKRDRLADAIRRLAPLAAVGTVSAAEIDAHGITWANQEAFRRALGGLLAKNQTGDLKPRLLLDGQIPLPGHPDHHCIVEGDGTYLNIAAASILAKVEHDRWIQATCDAEPGLAERYGLRTCMGYGTAVHRAGLKAHGAHAEHRTLFVRNWIPSGLHSKASNAKENKTVTGPCLIRI
jgi:ribonuclease HII